MSFFKKLANLFSAPSPSQGRYFYVYVQCHRCGEKIRGRVDLQNELSIDYGLGEDREGAGEVTYFVRKGLIGQERCFQTIEVELTFDKDHRLIDQRIKGGKFIEEAEYLRGREENP